MTSPTGPDDSTQVLTSLREHRAVRDRAEIAILNDVLDWCVLHQTDDEDAAAFGDHGIPLAGDGAPWVSEFAVMELGTALGVSTDSAKRYVGAALEVRYRLPRLWERVASGDLAFWKARLIAERTMCLPEAGAAFVDQRVAFVAHKIGYAELQRQIDAAQLRFDPDAAEKARRHDADRRCFDIHKDAVSPAGTVPVSGTLDLPDALDLDAALSARAAGLRDLGCEESLDVRRAMAVGDLARGQATFDYDRARPVVLHIHGDTVFGNPNPEANVGRCDNTRTPLLAETIREWCGNPHTTIIVKPVKDLADHIHVAAYEVPDPAGRARRSRGPALRVPVVHQTSGPVRLRPRRSVRRGRIHVFLQHSPALSSPPSLEDARRVDLRRPGPRHLPLAHPPRAPVPPGPHRHRTGRRPRSSTTLTAPHPDHRRGHRRAQSLASRRLGARALQEPVPRNAGASSSGTSPQG
ncbi:hypothetical protein NSZ01_37870 [Nocardioides szechwanensis]|uniref:DUF222 domain-containing protein n=1 Tax=Nocardioides szechwanensis TaxID=1005944 RepID=A0A1H0LT75_9ACTN|nr:DUF222 domain-containing protein [Nocardioides szechwanensis]GEP36019.1 hypothetical protein NSZ01_37870 [Nocardioides szechwanensis]SDO71231.1 protein of unknown function [Nocardioides szechwanensis]